MKLSPFPPRLIWPTALLIVATAAAPSAPARDIVVCDAAGGQSNPLAIADGKGGAVIAWADARNGNLDVFAQHVDAAGNVDPKWPARGLAVCEAVNDQGASGIASDGRGGAIVTWYDQRNGKDYDIYAQHVLASGSTDRAWPRGGVALCGAPGHQRAPTAVSDGAGGAIVTWFDYRSGQDAHIYAQRVLRSGVVDPRWPKDGAALCVASGSQFFPRA